MREVQEKLRTLLIAAQSLEGVPIEHPGRKYTDADRFRWRALYATPDLAMHTKRRAALLIARREGLPNGAAETIRRAI
ncbi:MAG: hypothetical protein EOO27_01720 [Comamonadaceae bacterium]|nr:MAG: hypothetical protein EOO27_01720 [Comamonadaceae bacterium]